MSNISNKLLSYGLGVRESENPERDPIDFDIEDGQDNVAWGWGQDVYSVEWECTHPEECVKYGDDDERSECLLCGATCDWHYEDEVVSESHNEDGGYTCKTAGVPHPHEWHSQRKVGGMIKEYIEEAYAKSV